MSRTAGKENQRKVQRICKEAPFPNESGLQLGKTTVHVLPHTHTHTQVYKVTLEHDDAINNAARLFPGTLASKCFWPCALARGSVLDRD